MLNAGMINDVKSVVNRINKLILCVFDSHSGENQNLKLNSEANRHDELESIIQEMENNEDFKQHEEKQEQEEIILGDKK